MLKGLVLRAAVAPGRARDLQPIAAPYALSAAAPVTGGPTLGGVIRVVHHSVQNCEHLCDRNAKVTLSDV